MLSRFRNVLLIYIICILHRPLPQIFCAASGGCAAHREATKRWRLFVEISRCDIFERSSWVLTPSTVCSFVYLAI